MESSQGEHPEEETTGELKSLVSEVVAWSAAPLRAELSENLGAVIMLIEETEISLNSNNK